MTRKYAPRRANAARWLESAPDYVLDVLDNKGKSADRYTVIFGKPFVFHVNAAGDICEGAGEFRNTYLQYLSLSEYPNDYLGVSIWGEFSAYDCAGYRRLAAGRRERIRWLDLPERVRAHVIARAALGESE